MIFKKIEKYWNQALDLLTYWFAESFFSSVHATIISALAGLVGVIGGIYATEIKDTYWGLIPGSGVHLAPGAKTFWAALAFATFYFWLRQWAVDRDARKNVRELKALIQTMPPAYVLPSVAELVRLHFRLMSDTLYRGTEPSVGDVAAVIRTILQTVSRIAWDYGHRIHGARFAASIMHYVPIANIDTDSNHVKDLLNLEVHHDFGLWKGILYFDKTLTATEQNPDEDEALVEFALPVPNDLKKVIRGEERYAALPGAPIAISSGETDYYADAWEISDWFETSGDFTREQREKLVAYFRNRDNKVRSFISIPILDDNNTELAILNIHADIPNIFGSSGESAPGFYYLVRPFTEMLVELLQKLNTIRPLNRDLTHN